MKRYWPLLAFALLAVLLAVGLKLKPREIPSPLIGKPIPAFDLERLDAPGRMQSANLKGRVWLLNVWASWCNACIAEHGLLLELAKTHQTPLVGLNYKDDDPSALAWLKQRGNPYTLVVADRDGRTGIDLGVYGVPETFVIGADGRILHKHIGPLTPEVIATEIDPLLEKHP